MVENLWTGVEAAYEYKKPLHLSNPEFSGFKVLSQEEAAQMEPELWLSTLSTQCVVVTDGKPQNWTFKRALLDLGLTAIRTIQGM